jgi:hypothetical protein
MDFRVDFVAPLAIPDCCGVSSWAATWPKTWLRALFTRDVGALLLVADGALDFGLRLQRRDGVLVFPAPPGRTCGGAAAAGRAKPTAPRGAGGGERGSDITYFAKDVHVLELIAVEAAGNIDSFTSDDDDPLPLQQALSWPRCWPGGARDDLDRQSPKARY